MIEVKPIQSYETYDWLLNVHYAKRIPSISFAFGLFNDGVLKGIVTYGMPASKFLCEGIAGKFYKNDVIELNRLCFIEKVKNYASILVSKSLKMLPKPKIVVSYADTAMGHIGYVYQACNFMFTGTTKERTDMASTDGNHSRHNLGNSEIRINRSAKHRYVMICARNIKEKKKIMNAINYKQKPYPKGDSENYEITHQPEYQSCLF